MKIIKILVAAIFVLILGTAYNYINFVIKDLKSTIAEYEEKIPNCKEYSLFEQAVARIGNREYILDEYDCVDFSRDLVRELEKDGIKSVIATSKTHAWVLVFVEATTGEFISPNRKLEISDVRDRDMNVICGQPEEPWWMPK